MNLLTLILNIVPKINPFLYQLAQRGTFLRNQDIVNCRAREHIDKIGVILSEEETRNLEVVIKDDIDL